MSMEKFYTRKQSNDGIKLPLPLPDGSPSGYHLIIKGKYSDDFRINEADMKRKALEVVSKYPEDKKKRDQMLLKLEITFLASLVTGWSLDDEFNTKNVETFLREAPQVRDLVDLSVAKNSLFFGKSSTDSLNSAEQPSNSTESQKDQKSQSEDISNK